MVQVKCLWLSIGFIADMSLQSAYITLRFLVFEEVIHLR